MASWRRLPLSKLLRRVWKRYRSDLLLTETAHIGDIRSIWMHCLAEEGEKLLEEGVPPRGACLYPILGMPEWHEREKWTRMGWWDVVPRHGRLKRVAYGPMLDALRSAQRLDRRFTDFLPGDAREHRCSVAEPSGESL